MPMSKADALNHVWKTITALPVGSSADTVLSAAIQATQDSGQDAAEFKTWFDRHGDSVMSKAWKGK